MQSYIKDLEKYCKENSIHFDHPCFETLLELLWYFHTQYYPIDNEVINAHFAALDPILKSLSRKRQRKLINSVIKLCTEHQRTAFSEGIRVGVQLLLEVRE